jgi:hypothetical protein
VIAPHSLILFDASAVIIMVIIAYLSRRIGEALKVPPYYRLLYLTSLLIALTAIGDTVGNDIKIVISQDIPLCLRFVSAASAFLVCLRYWNWLFSEYFKK